jgi:mannitol/fructose-specific phosphotransferase system IIA component (Ntr-type)
LAQEGQRAAAEQILRVQQMVLAHSSFGRSLQERAQRQEAIIAAVSADLDALPEDADRAELLDLAIGYGEREEREDYLQALVALVRPAMDDEFFNQLTLRIGQAPTSARASMEMAGDLIREYIAALDQQTQAAMQNAVDFLQALVNHPDPDAMLRANVDMIDDALMAVLTANMQQAQRRGDRQMETRLRDTYNRIMAFLDANMQPELRFINQLLSTPSDEEARTLLKSDGGQFASAALIEMMDAVEQILESRGETAMLGRLALLREDAAALGGD